jgi:predicted ATPase/DNA-binding winged helix-turn-helix (wHTH) protein
MDDESQGNWVASFGPFRLVAAERLLMKEGAPVSVGGRALDILIALIERAGDVVCRWELIDRVWPDVIVEEANLRVHVHNLRKALGDGRDGARYVTNVPGRGYCFVALVRHSAGAEPGLPIPAAENPARPQKLPIPLSRMVGREKTAADLCSQLTARRFVSIVGPGGMGKTTVAVSVGHRLLTDFDGAVCFFDLGPLNDPLLVPSAVASTLGLLIQSNDPTLGLIAFLRDRRMLLILDSCEHVIESAAALAERIFGDAPHVHILTTTRESLRVEGEHVYQLSPLDNSPDAAGLTAEQVLAFPAAQLFVERVVAGGRRFELSDADAPIVAEICRRLDGIPLAIELAAGCVNALGLRGTAERLDSWFRLRWRGRRTAQARHQTLRATLDWSYDLLSESERVVLRRLSVFVGFFTVDAAQSVAMGDDLSAAQVVEAVAGLVAKSLVSVDTVDVTSRYRLLDTTRAYALPKLIDADAADDTARRHAIHFLEFLERAANSRPVAFEAKVLAAHRDHLGNVRAALEWSFFECGDIRIGTALAAASARVFLEMSLLTECHRWTERAIAALDDDTRGTSREMELHSALGLSLMFTKGNSEQARIALTKGLALAEKLNDRANQLRLLGRLHIFHERIGDFHTALAFAQRSEAIAAEAAEPVGIAEAHSILGISRHLEGSTLRAHAHLKAALVPVPPSHGANTFRFGFDYRNRARIAFARTLWLEGFPEQAVTVAEETVQEAETLTHPISLCIALIWAVSVYIWTGDLAAADVAINKFIAQADQYSLAPYQAVGRGVKGELSIKRGETEAGIALVHSALEAVHGLRYELLTTAFNSALVEGLAMRGRFEDALTMITETIALVERNGDLFMMPELLRVKGSVLASSPFADMDVCGHYFRRSLELAREQGALAWELRAATSLALLLAKRERPGEAHGVLSPVYGRFTEGFESRDLKRAKSLLEELDRPRLVRGST